MRGLKTWTSVSGGLKKVGTIAVALMASGLAKAGTQMVEKSMPYLTQRTN